jgi:murein DD-endopeptidase MepM/ murein hydrolase activator NlpD
MSLSDVQRRNRPAIATLVAGLLLGGCSADVARFDFPSLGVNDKGGETGSIPKPSQSVARMGGSDLTADAPREAPSGNATYTPPRAVRGGQDLQVSALPEPSQPAATAPSVPPARRATAPADPPAAVLQPSPAPPAKGEAIEVQSGDTLYGLAKRHKVSLAELTAVNDLKSPKLKPGQKLYLPAGKVAATGRPQKPLTKPTPLSATAPQAVSPGAASWAGTYTIKPGDSLYNIARQHRVPLAELQQVNGIADPRKVKPGIVLKVPGENAGSATNQTTAAPAADAARAVSTTRPTVINPGADKRFAAARTESATDADPSAADGRGEQVAAAAPAVAASSGRLRWPAKGKIIAGFGPRTDGSHNDGINVAVPMGTDIHSAESGVVAYAGNELKGYGNLILVRHDNGWVTAYAHAEQILVKRGDKVKRGQVIAKAGKTGTVDQPQVHFELRQGSKPVDPTPFMEKM